MFNEEYKQKFVCTLKQIYYDKHLRMDAYICVFSNNKCKNIKFYLLKKSIIRKIPFLIWNYDVGDIVDDAIGLIAFSEKESDLVKLKLVM